MDSSHKNPSYSLWQPPSALFRPPPSIPHRFHSYDQSRPFDHHHHRQDLPQKSAVNPQPYRNFSITESRDLSQSAWVGYMEKRLDAGLDRSYHQLEYGDQTKDCSDGVFTRDLDSNSRSRDGFCSPAYARRVFGDVRVEESYLNCGKFNSESDEYFRSLRAGTSFSHGNVPFGATLYPDIIRNSESYGETGNQRWVDYFHSEIEQDFDNGKRKGSDELNQTTKKPRQVRPQKKKKQPRQVESLLLLDIPRENDRSSRPDLFNDKRLNSFKGKDHSDYGSMEMETVDVKETSCTAEKKKENISQPALSDIENLSGFSEGGIPFLCKSLPRLQPQSCEDEIPKKDMDALSSRNLQMEEANDNIFTVQINTSTGVDYLDRTVVSQAESKTIPQSQACENGVNSSAKIFSRKETLETTSLDSTAVLDRELSSAMYMEDASLAPNQDMGSSSHDPVEIPSVNQSCDLSCRGLKACLSKSIASPSKDVNVGASEFHLNQEVREKAPTRDKFSSSRVLEIENSLSMVPVNVRKRHTWHRKSNTSAYPLVAGKPKEIVQSSSTYVRKGNSLLRKPSPGALGDAQTLKRRSRKCASPPGMDTIAGGLPGSSSGEAADTDFSRNELKISDTLIQTGYASQCQSKQNPPTLESSNPIKMLYVTRKANQLVAPSSIHGASSSKAPSGGYFKRSKNQLVRNSESLANQAKSLQDAALDSQTGEKMGPKRSSSLMLSEFVLVRPFNHSNFSWTLKEPLSRKDSKVHINPQKIVPQSDRLKRVTYRTRLMNPASVLRNGYFSTISRKLLMMRKRHKVYRRSTNGKDTSIPKKMVMGNDKSVWVRNGSQLLRDPKKPNRVLVNEKVRWSLRNARLLLAKRRNYCQFFTRFGKCNKDDGKCPYIHDPLKIAVCTKFLSGLCANPDCKLTHKVVPETMPDCYYFLQGLCNNESCPYRHVHVHQNAAICEGFLRGYCSDGIECRKKHTYTCQVFEATGSCPQGSECKLHHRKNLSKGTKRKRETETWQQCARGRYFGSLKKDIPESKPLLVNELAIAGAVFGEEGPDFIRLDVNEEEARENMDSSTTESVSDDSEEQNSTDELIRPVRLMQK